MKLDRISFAKLIGFIGNRGACLSSNDIKDIDDLIDIEVKTEIKLVSVDDLDNLITQIKSAKDVGFIPAIKAYRAITGVGLKQAKLAIERFR